MIKNWQLFLEELVGDKPISDLQDYIDGMNYTMSDKLFFIDKVNFDLIVDFGCADGTFLQNLSKINPKVKMIGYDLDENMLEKARKRLPNAKFTSDWKEVKKLLWHSKSPLLNLSSVIHEVYSYSNEVKSFWNEKVFSGDFKYITIRDMIPSLELSREELPKFKDDIKNVRKKSDKYILDSFENRWGSITSYKNLIHYLMKYRFTDNWERELNENYLPISLETLKGKIPSNYKIVFEENFLLEFLKKQVKNDFNVELTHPTHLKMILKRND
jgi:hypothetical protein